ncbi:MAG: flagellin [Sphingobium sp.]
MRIIEDRPLMGMTGTNIVALRARNGPDRGDIFDLIIGNGDMGRVTGASVPTAADAEGMQGRMDDFPKTLTGVRAGLGAKRGRLESALSALPTGMTEAIGRMVDADYGAEGMALAKARIMVQSSAAMLAQANPMQKAMARTLPPG